MKLERSAITQLASEGRLTTQVPTININFGNSRPPKQTLLDFPDEFFMKRHINNHRLSFGKENSFLFLSRIGFEVYKHELYNSYNAFVQQYGYRNKHDPQTQQDYFDFFKQWYDLVDKNTITEAMKRGLA